MARTEVPKLHLGAGPNRLPGWLNTDLAPSCSEVVFVDATQPLPFDDGTFRYVFTEHMIEHLTFDQGLQMLEECHRVLAPGGRVRIATPNLLNLVALFIEPRQPEAERYVRWACTFNSLPQALTSECVVLNNFMRAWDHQFVYDAGTLQHSLETAGFVEVTYYEPGVSGDETLRDLERHGRVIGDEFNRFETMVLEAGR